MRVVKTLSFALLIVGLNACTMRIPPHIKSGTFGYDLEFLKAKDSVVVLKSDDGKGQVIVSPKYQAKIFTSTADGLNGKSFGWIKYETFDAKQPDAVTRVQPQIQSLQDRHAVVADRRLLQPHQRRGQGLFRGWQEEGCGRLFNHGRDRAQPLDHLQPRLRLARLGAGAEAIHERL